MHVCQRAPRCLSTGTLHLQRKQRTSNRAHSLLQRWEWLTASTVCEPGKQVGVVLVDHGSRRAAANEALEEFASLFRKTTTHKIVEIAHMELVEPTIAQAIEKCCSNGCTHVVVLPYFLSKGRHVSEDIPQLVQQATAGLPDISVAIAEPIGVLSHCACPVASGCAVLATTEHGNTAITGVDVLMAKLVDNRVKGAMAKFS